MPKLASNLPTQSLQFIRPVDEFSITSGFGNRLHPISGDLRFHAGIDFATPNGTPVKASVQGIVAFAGWHGGYGKTVIIQHRDAYETLYAHLDEILVNSGDRVAQGKVIGLSGSTGYSTGPHLHFEIRSHQVAHNPMDYLPAFELIDALGNKLPVRVISRR
jgi:murein DD-endopeptidase MepM/ murein hydrolase activator NlpD